MSVDHIPKRIQRQRVRGWKSPPGTVYVGRPTKWGNWAPVSIFGREGAVELYRLSLDGSFNPRWPGFVELSSDTFENVFLDWQAWLKRFGKDSPGLSAHYELCGHDLSCWCQIGVACHCDVLLEVANAAS